MTRQTCVCEPGTVIPHRYSPWRRSRGHHGQRRVAPGSRAGWQRAIARVIHFDALYQGPWHAAGRAFARSGLTTQAATGGFALHDTSGYKGMVRRVRSRARSE